jgi:hypothetical protein
MSRLILQTALVAGLALSAASTAWATPAAMVRPAQTTLQTQGIMPVYYTWNHHRYDHRRWDAAHKRWHYY